VPRLRADHEVKGAAGGVPFLERGDFHGQAVTASDLGHPLVRLDSEDFAVPRREQPRRLPGPASHVENTTRMVDDEGVDEFGRVGRAGSLVLRRCLTERPCPSAIIMDHRTIVPRTP